MKAGDLVRPTNRKFSSARVGLVVRVFMHKLWDSGKLGSKVNWDKIKPQPFAEILWNSGAQTKMPQSSLEVLNESR